MVITKQVPKHQMSYYLMTELELQQHLLREYPQENAQCEWKKFKNLRNSFCGDEKDDVIFYGCGIGRDELRLVGVK